MELLTVADVAKELRVSKVSVVRLIDTGRLRAVEGLGKGRGIRVRREWLDAFIAEGAATRVPHALLATPTAAPANRNATRRPRGVPSFSSVREARLALLPSAPTRSSR